MVVGVKVFTFVENYGRLYLLYIERIVNNFRRD